MIDKLETSSKVDLPSWATHVAVTKAVTGRS